MAMPIDPFQPGTEAAQASDPTQSAAQEWTSALNDPKVRSSLLSFGLSMMVPGDFGSTFGSRLAQSVGAAGETLDRRDAEDRADREQARKEADTQSQIQYRSDTSDTRAISADAAVSRANAALTNADSLALQRRSNVQLNQAKVDQIGANVRMLELKVQMYPQDQQAKQDLMRSKQELAASQAALYDARTLAVAPLTESQINRNEAAAGLSNRRAAAVDTNANIATRRLDIAEKKGGLQQTLDSQRGERQLIGIYQKARQENEKQRFLDPKLPPFPSFQDWKEQNGLNPKSDTAPPVPPASPAAPTAVPPTAPQPTAQPTAPAQIPSVEVAPRDPAQRTPGKVYQTPRGPLKWTGTGWVQ